MTLDASRRPVAPPEATALRWGTALLAALAPAVLLVVDPRGWHPFGPAKWLALVLLAGPGAVLLGSQRRPRLPRSLAIVLGLLVGWMAVAAAVGEDPWFAWVGTPERRFGWLTWALCAVLLAVGSALAAARLVVGGLVVAAFGLGMLATVEALGWEPAVFDVAGRLTATLGSAAYLGAAAALLLPVALGVALDPSVGGALRRAARCALPLLAVALVGSGARAAWAGLLVAALVVAVIQRARIVAAPRRSAAAAAGLLLGLVALAVLTPAGSRVGSLLDADAAGGQGRLDEWRVGAAVASGHLLAGVGPEGYRVAFAEGVDAAYVAEHGRDQQPDRAHSAPLDILLAGGIPALALWGAAVTLVGRSVLQALRHGPPWRAGLAGGLLAHGIGQLALFPLAETEPLAWLLAGVLVGAVPLEPASARGPSELRPPVGARRWAVVSGTVVAVVLVAGAVAGVAADLFARRAADALARGDGHGAASAAATAVALRPDWPRLALLDAHAAVADDQGLHESLAALRRGLRWSPGDPILRRAEVAVLVDRALATGSPAHRAEAEAAVRSLLSADPHDEETRAQADRLTDRRP